RTKRRENTVPGKHRGGLSCWQVRAAECSARRRQLYQRSAAGAFVFFLLPRGTAHERRVSRRARLALQRTLAVKRCFHSCSTSGRNATAGTNARRPPAGAERNQHPQLRAGDSDEYARVSSTPPPTNRNAR